MTMKTIIERAIVFVVISLALYAVAWIAASVGVMKDVEIGYYGGFNVAKHAIQKTGCTEKIEYSGVNKDLVLEEMHFKVTTRSGRIVRLWFDASNLDLSQVCYQPVGFSVCHPAHEQCQRYSVAGLANLLKEKGFQAKNLKDILCNIDGLDHIFKENYGDANASRESDPYAWEYLRI